MRKFFVDQSAVYGASIYINDPGDCRHLQKVLRAKPGDKIRICDGSDWEYETQIVQMEPSRVELKILDKQKIASEPEVRVTLYQGIPKASKMETVIQKNVELGIDTIVPVFMKRTVVVEKANIEKKLSRWQKISDEAAKQCKRGMIPQVQAPQSFTQMTKELSKYDLILCPYENEQNTTMKDCLRNMCNANKKPGNIAVIIGPEGGFAEEEIHELVAKEVGAECVSLGKTILRTETAGVVALAMILYELEL